MNTPPFKWTDIYLIAEYLHEQYPHIAPLSVRFTDLQRMVCELEGFSDEPARCNEKILEAIQMAWLDEM